MGQYCCCCQGAAEVLLISLVGCYGGGFALYPLLCFLGIRAVSGDMSFIFVVEETVLPLRLLIMVFVLVSALVVSFVVLLVL